jgi:uncharacterized protein (TIGR02757 family)
MKKNFFNLFEDLHKIYNADNLAYGDPVCTLYEYDNLSDREVAGFIASSLAFGKAEQIVINAKKITQKMKNPYEYLTNCTTNDLKRDFSNFVYRYVKGEELIDFLYGLKNVIQKFKSIENAISNFNSNETVFEGYKFFYENINKLKLHPNKKNYLIVNPLNQSACKRLNLFLRWMVRKDAIDPGGYNKISKKQLFIPLDLHMMRFSAKAGITFTKSANKKNCILLTDWFKSFIPKDPVKYDFAITRMLMSSDKEKFKKNFFEKLNNYKKLNYDIIKKSDENSE